MRKSVGIWLLALLLTVVPLIGGATPPSRTAAGGKYALELDGVLVGWLNSVDGGYATAEVASAARKHVAGVKYEDITMTVGADLDPKVLGWIQSLLDGKTERKSGSIIYIDREGTEAARLNFYDAMIAEVAFPALDAASKDAAKMTIKISPEYTRRLPGSGKAVDVRRAKAWLVSNFRLRIDGLESATERVNKIEAIVVKQRVSRADGDQRDPATVPAGLEVSNLAMRVSSTSANPLYAWHEEFVIQGRNSESEERSGTLELLAPDMRTVLLRLKLQGLGIVRAEPAEADDQVEAEMYLNALQVDQP